MKFKFLFCSMFVLIGAAQSTGLRVLGRAGAVSLQTHVRYGSVRYCTFKHGTEFKVPPGLKLAEISTVGLAPKADKNQVHFARPYQPIDISKYCIDRARGLLYRYQTAEEVESEKAHNFPLATNSTGVFDLGAVTPNLLSILSSIGSIDSVFDLGSRRGRLYARGTGFVIRPDAILTAAHVVSLEISHENIREIIKPIEINFAPECEVSAVKNAFKVIDFKIPDEWKKHHDPAYDFALLFLERSILESKIKLASIESWMKLPIPARVAGYPKEICDILGFRIPNIPLSLYSHSGYLRCVSSCSKLVQYDCFTDCGMSGGPIIVGEPPISIGIHTNGRDDYNSGVHYSEHMAACLTKWFAERDNATQDAQVKLEKLIAELAQSEEEKEHLLSCKDILEKYPSESWRSHLAFYLEIYRKKH